MFAIEQELPADLLEQFIQAKGKQGAVTITRRQSIGDHIADARIVFATSEAAGWYGLPDPSMLIGSWISILQHPDDEALTRSLAIARHFGGKVPTSYVTRVSQVGRPGRFRAVQKEASEFMIGSETYWMTILRQPTGLPLTLQHGARCPIDLPDKSLTSDFSRLMSVADFQRLMGAGGALTATALSLHIPRGKTAIINGSNYAHHCTRCGYIWFSKKLDPARCGKRSCQSPLWRHPPRMLGGLEAKEDSHTSPPTAGGILYPTLAPGGTFRMPTGRYIHWCAVCKNLWRSDDEQPRKCGYRKCHSPHWQVITPK